MKCITSITIWYRDLHSKRFQFVDLTATKYQLLCETLINSMYFGMIADYSVINEEVSR